MTNNSTNIRELDYLTRNFVRDQCSSNGAVLSDADCDRIIEQTQQLYTLDRFHHTGVYWIANQLAADGVITPSFKQH